MKNKKWSESEILKILKAYENGATAKELGRQYGFCHQTLYEWKKRYSGVENTSELKRLRELEKENRQLKKMYAEVSMEREALKDVLSKSGKACSSRNHC